MGTVYGFIFIFMGALYLFFFNSAKKSGLADPTFIHFLVPILLIVIGIAALLLPSSKR